MTIGVWTGAETFTEIWGSGSDGSEVSGTFTLTAGAFGGMFTLTDGAFGGFGTFTLTAGAFGGTFTLTDGSFGGFGELTGAAWGRFGPGGGRERPPTGAPPLTSRMRSAGPGGVVARNLLIYPVPAIALWPRAFSP